MDDLSVVGGLLHLAGQGVPPGADPTAAREAAREILGRPEYAEPEPSVVERAGEWVLDRIGSFFGTLTGGGPGSIIGWMVVAALVGGATWLLVRALQVPDRGRRVGGPELRYGTETRLDRAGWLAEADRLEAAGDRRGALRCRYQALVATVVADRLVDDVPGRTAGEYRRLLAERLPDLAGDVHALTGTFEEAWYGGAAVGPDDLRRFEQRCARVEAGAPRAVAAT